MIPPKIVLLIGNSGENVQAIKQSLSAQYQVVLFQKVEKEVSWFNPIAIILHQNGSPADEVRRQLRQLKQFKPHAPVLLCHSGQKKQAWQKYPEGIHSALYWPGDLSRLKGLLQDWEHRRHSLTGRLQMVWQAMGSFFSRSFPRQEQACLPDTPTNTIAGHERLEARLLGPFELHLNGRLLPPIRSEINRAILAYLLLNGPDRLLRHKIIEGFWPDSNEEAARNCLNVAICSVRRYWRDNGEQNLKICFRENAYHLHLPVSYHNDVAHFLKLWERAKSLERTGRMDEALNAYRQACSLYTGDFLEGVSRNIEWVESTRSKLREAYLSILGRLSVLFIERGLSQEAEETCLKILDIDDCLESAHRQLMLIYYTTNRRGRALRQYTLCCRILQEKLGVEPFRETEVLYNKILAGRL